MAFPERPLIARASLAALALLALPALGLTRPPVTYVLDYGKNHLEDEDLVSEVATAPPTLLHLGKDGPMTHSWGPVRHMGGENQAHGKGEDIERISADAVAQRIEGLKAMNAALHAAGVEYITPYICLMTLAGDAEKRSGFFEFYDHWDEYADAFGLGPRPERDPIEWMQLRPDGSLMRFYGYGDGYYPPWEVNHRYVASIVDPDWRQWLTALVRMLGEVGFDGAFVDNGGSYRSYDPRSQALFREWMAERYTPAQLQELFGVGSAAELSLDPELEGLLGAETKRFWLAEVHDFLALLTETGTAAAGEPFQIWPNGAHQWSTLKYAHQDTPWSMFELSHGTYGTNPGRVREPVVEDIAFHHYNRHGFKYLYPQAVPGQVRALILTRGGYPRTLPHLDINPAAAELGMAEAAAFSGGGGFLLRPRYDIHGEAMRRYRDFFESRAALYDGLAPAGRVALLASVDHELLGERGHLDAAEAAADVLGARQIPYMPVIEENWTAAGLADYDAVVAPWLTYLSPEQAAALVEVARTRPVYLVGKAPTKDWTDRDAPALAALADAPGVTLLDGLGALETEAGLEPLRLLAPHPRAERAVRLMAYVDPQRAGRRLVHLVNYDVQLGRDGSAPDAGQVTPVEGLRLTLPEGWRATKATAYSPDGDAPRELSVDGASIDLPSLRIYTVIELEGGA